MPPMTTVANGRCTPAPVLIAIAIGINPREATKAVIKIGLSRVIAPSSIARSSDIPCSRRPRMYETITKPLSTATPDNAMKPTPAEIERGISRK